MAEKVAAVKLIDLGGIFPRAKGFAKGFAYGHYAYFVSDTTTYLISDTMVSGHYGEWSLW
jgi:hypothetical protein